MSQHRLKGHGLNSAKAGSTQLRERKLAPIYLAKDNLKKHQSHFSLQNKAASTNRCN